MYNGWYRTCKRGFTERGLGWGGWTGAWIITGGTQAGVMQFVGEAAREYMLQSGKYKQQLVVFGISALGHIANREAIKKFSIADVEKVHCHSLLDL